MEQKFNRILQSGRSMLEILGVLVIVSMLSIGGIVGYRFGGINILPMKQFTN